MSNGTRAQGKVVANKGISPKKRFDYEEAILETKLKIHRWRNEFSELIFTLHDLKKEIGRQKKYAWNEVCTELGLEQKQVDKWLQTRKELFDAIDEVTAKLKRRKKYGK